MSAEAGVLCAAFATGVGSSLGPCAAPRFVVASVCASGSRAWLKTIAFACGTIGGYFVYALAGGALGLLRASSHAVYAAISIALLIGGLAILRRSPAHACCARAARPAGGMFALGASSALTLSPCCTPIALALGMQASLGPDTLLAVGSLAAFGAGHAFPLLGLAGGITYARRRWPLLQLRGESSIVSGTILLGVGAVYGVLA